MILVPTPEQQELRTAVRSFLETTSTRTAMEMPDGYDPAVYARLNGELGLSGLIVPEEYGGAGAGFAELAVVLEETGAALLPGPFLATTFATIALLQAPDKELLTAIAEGRTTATLVTGPGPVMDAEVVLADTGTSLVLAEPHKESLTGLDPTRRMARVTVSGGRTLTDDPAALARARDLCMVALAAEQLGVIRASLDAIVAYAKIRVAFGRYIGSYQGVKHKMADMHGKLEQAESIVRFAAWAADESPDELPLAAALAQAHVGRACFEVAGDHLLLHGGIGFTWEHDAHLYYKRAKADEVLLGPPYRHRTRIADLLEL
ncbi:acyl-CoA dehydrogenase family protein [Nonomuraea sp. NPDC050556]|uniref:acyl-CoA dehydrogenase family protein n=1 Tax=Nonomuraea sp. NPDC050556 TaxID=3364369 RepID=UPI00379F32E6